MNLRDAEERIKDVNDSIELRRRIDSAVLTDDPTYARAIVARAFAIQDADTVNAFAAAYPASAAATKRLWNAATTGVTAQGIGMVWRLGTIKPPALASKIDYEIASIAGARQASERGMPAAEPPDHPGSRVASPMGMVDGNRLTPGGVTP